MPCAPSASGSETPSRSVSLRARPGRASSRPPRRSRTALRPKRAPSSSAQSTSRTVTGGSPSSAIRRSTSTPASTLRQPSSQPPFGTESMWPPIRSACSERPGSVNHWLPASSAPARAGQPRPSPRSHSRARVPGLRPRDPLRAVLVAGQLAELLSSATVRAGSSGIGPRSYNRRVVPSPGTVVRIVAWRPSQLPVRGCGALRSWPRRAGLARGRRGADESWRSSASGCLPLGLDVGPLDVARSRSPTPRCRAPGRVP